MPDLHKRRGINLHRRNGCRIHLVNLWHQFLSLVDLKTYFSHIATHLVLLVLVGVTSSKEIRILFTVAFMRNIAAQIAKLVNHFHCEKTDKR